jgi:hypothetical protein
MKSILKNLTTTVAVTTLTVSTILGTGAAIAATDGLLGATSSGSIALSFTKTLQAQITGLDDLTLAAYTLGDGDKVLSDTFCVYSSAFDGQYTVKVTGNGAGNTFQSNNTISGYNLPYAVYWDDGGVGALAATKAGATAVVSDTTLTGQKLASTVSTTCATGNTGKVFVEALGTDLDAAPGGTYTGTITILVTPEP